jgi:CIC family chloride channel protein
MTFAGRWRAAGARFFVSSSFPKKWLVLGTVIGIIAGLGAVAFLEALKLATHFLLGEIGGYHVPTPIGEGRSAASPGFARPWAIPLVVGGGGLVSAALVFGIAPDAEGHGTDAAIFAVHENPRGIRLRTVIVKIVASAITIGSGGSAGREGPTGQISAGFGSLLARLFDLSPADARVAVAAGVGSGIGSIFGAPLGGAVLAAEILYREDFEVEALLPSFIASIVAYALFGAVEGYGPLFGFVTRFQLAYPLQLGWFAVIGVIGGLVGLLYAKGFYGVSDVVARLPVTRFLKPAIGGLCVGLIALAIPEVLGTGYGWIQQGLGPGLTRIPFWIVLLLPFARILATGLSIGSGGSGGIFGPGMVIGAFVGAGVWDGAHRLGAGVGHDPAPFVVVGMMACFGSIARAPLAVMLMVAEMTGTLTIVVPAMLAVGLATLIVRRNDDTIYRSQLRNREESPAHRLLAGMPLLARIPISTAMVPPRLVLAADTPVREAVDLMRQAGVVGAPVTDGEGRFAGIVGLDALERVAVAEGQGPTSKVGAATDTTALPVQAVQRVDVALETITTSSQSWVPVLDGDRRVVGTLALSDMVRAYRRELQATLRHMEGTDEAGAGVREVVIEPGSPMAGRSVREAGLPRGAVLTTVERGRTVLVPDGRTVLEPGDRLVVLGPPAAAGAVSELARQAGVMAGEQAFGA